MTDNCEKLRKRFENGETNMSVEYCAHEDDGSIRWVQKTILMTRMVVFDAEILAEEPMIYAIILLQDTTQRHERDEQEQARLQAEFNEMRAETVRRLQLQKTADRRWSTSKIILREPLMPY